MQFAAEQRKAFGKLFEALVGLGGVKEALALAKKVNIGDGLSRYCGGRITSRNTARRCETISVSGRSGVRFDERAPCDKDL